MGFEGGRAIKIEDASRILTEFRAVNAERLFHKEITCFFKGPSPASPAYADIFAASATALIQGKISQFLENRRFFPYFLQALFSYVPTPNFQIPAGLDIPAVGNETKPDSPKASSCHGIQTMGLRGYPFSLSSGPLPQNTIILWRASRL